MAGFKVQGFQVQEGELQEVDYLLRDPANPLADASGSSKSNPPDEFNVCANGEVYLYKKTNHPPQWIRAQLSADKTNLIWQVILFHPSQNRVLELPKTTLQAFIDEQELLPEDAITAILQAEKQQYDALRARKEEASPLEETPKKTEDTGAQFTPSHTLPSSFLKTDNQRETLEYLFNMGGIEKPEKPVEYSDEDWEAKWQQGIRIALTTHHRQLKDKIPEDMPAAIQTMIHEFHRYIKPSALNISAFNEAPAQWPSIGAVYDCYIFLLKQQLSSPIDESQIIKISPVFYGMRVGALHAREKLQYTGLSKASEYTLDSLVGYAERLYLDPHTAAAQYKAFDSCTIKKLKQLQHLMSENPITSDDDDRILDEYFAICSALYGDLEDFDKIYSVTKTMTLILLTEKLVKLNNEKNKFLAFIDGSSDTNPLDYGAEHRILSSLTYKEAVKVCKKKDFFTNPQPDATRLGLVLSSIQVTDKATFYTEVGAQLVENVLTTADSVASALESTDNLDTAFDVINSITVEKLKAIIKTAIDEKNADVDSYGDPNEDSKKDTAAPPKTINTAPLVRVLGAILSKIETADNIDSEYADIIFKLIADQYAEAGDQSIHFEKLLEELWSENRPLLVHVLGERINMFIRNGDELGAVLEQKKEEARPSYVATVIDRILILIQNGAQLARVLKTLTEPHKTAVAEHFRGRLKTLCPTAFHWARLLEEIPAPFQDEVKQVYTLTEIRTMIGTDAMQLFPVIGRLPDEAFKIALLETFGDEGLSALVFEYARSFVWVLKLIPKTWQLRMIGCQAATVQCVLKDHNGLQEILENLNTPENRAAFVTVMPGPLEISVAFTDDLVKILTLLPQTSWETLFQKINEESMKTLIQHFFSDTLKKMPVGLRPAFIKALSPYVQQLSSYRLTESLTVLTIDAHKILLLTAIGDHLSTIITDIADLSKILPLVPAEFKMEFILILYPKLHKILTEHVTFISHEECLVVVLKSLPATQWSLLLSALSLSESCYLPMLFNIEKVIQALSEEQTPFFISGIDALIVSTIRMSRYTDQDLQNRLLNNKDIARSHKYHSTFIQKFENDRYQMTTLPEFVTTVFSDIARNPVVRGRHIPEELISQAQTATTEDEMLTHLYGKLREIDTGSSNYTRMNRVPAHDGDIALRILYCIRKLETRKNTQLLQAYQAKKALIAPQVSQKLVATQI